NALTFATDDYVTREALSANITGECTISLWMKRTGNPSANERLVCVGESNKSGFNVYVGTNGYAGLDNEGGLTSDLVSTGPSITDGVWHHIAATRSGTAPSTFKIYVDGVLKGTDSNVNNTVPALTRLRVGASFGPGSYFNGQIDDVRVYNQALSGTEIQALYNSVQAAPINIGGRLELFVDKHLIQTLSNATLRLHQPVGKGAVFSLDAPWEGNYSAYQSVVKDGNRFHLYGRGFRRLGGDVMQGGGTFAFPAVTCFRMSSDGINWEIPSVGLHAFNGSTDNSIVWTNNSLTLASGYSGCFIVSMNANPNAPAQEKFIALAHREDSGTHSIFTSPDGVTFTMKPNPVKVEPSDAGGDPVFWDSNLGQYAAYLRAWYNPTTGQVLSYNGGAGYYRWVQRKLSPDLTNWSAPVLMSFKDASGNPLPAEHYYTFSNEQYSRAPHLYIAMPSRYMATRRAVPAWYRDGGNDAVFCTSRDGLVWDRTFMEAFIRPGTDRLNWTSKAVYPVRGVVQTGTNELSVYWLERFDHGDLAPRIRRGTLRLDGFASVRAEAAGGEMVTKPITFTGSRLVLNHVTAATGSVRVEIQDASGTPIPGYALANSTARTGDKMEETMSWTGGSDLSALAGTTIRLRFVLQDSDVYTMRFTN
ncbi:MAG: LamG domain-containing protein, partial [Nitrospiraceae bacterium]